MRFQIVCSMVVSDGGGDVLGDESEVNFPSDIPQQVGKIQK